jgi:hypothetical protein
LQLNSITTSPDKNPKKNCKSASPNQFKKYEVPEHMRGTKIDMSLGYVGRSLSTVALREKMMSIDAWILDSMHDDLSPRQVSLFPMVQVKSVQFKQHHRPLLIAEFRRNPDTIPFEPASVLMQTVNDRDPRSCVRDAPQLLWHLLDKLYAL